MEQMLILALVAVAILVMLYTMCQEKKQKSANHKHKHAAYTHLQKFVENKPSVIYFYSPSCGFCQQFDPVWDHMVALLGRDSPVMLAKISAQNLQEITSYPTIMYFPGGQNAPMKYTGPRDIESIAQWIDMCILY